MSESNKDQVEYENRLRRRLKILQEKLEQGKVKFAEGLKVIDSLKAVRTGADGEIDLSTVDGLVRSMALAVTEIHDREELKKSATLSEIQNAYFNFFERNFGEFYELMLKKKITPHHAGLVASRNADTVLEMREVLTQLLPYIDEFWTSVGDIAHAHVEDQVNNIKGVFGGDLFPSHSENIASKCGIYTDTIILPDPFLRSKHIFENAKPEYQAYFVMKHAMNILQYRQLACADVEIPIVVILPDVTALEKEEKDFIYELGIADSLKHSSRLFGRKFESLEELLEFAGELDTIEQAVAAIDDKSRFLFDTEWEGDMASQLEQALNSPQYELAGTKVPGLLLASQSVGRMATCNELLIKSRRLRGSPLIDAPTSWRYLSWKLEYDASEAEEVTHIKDLHISRGLQDLAAGEMQWLGQVPPASLIEVRKQGAMDEIRSILGNGIKELIEINPSNFHRSRDQLFININQAFDSHKKNIEALRSKQWKFAGSDIGSWLVTGTLGITAAATGAPIWALAALGVDQILDAPKLRDIPNSIKELIDENKRVNMSPVGLLFDIKQKIKK